LKKHWLYSLIIVFLFVCTSGQNGITSHPDWFIKPVIHQGFILEHRSTIGHLVKGYPTIYQLDIGKPTLGDKLWHIENNKPDIGLNVAVIDFKNPEQLGYSFSLAPFVDIPLNKNELRKTRVVMRLCWGICYLNKPFDIKKNPKNIAIGSHVNSFVQFKWMWQIPLTKQFTLEPGFAFNHASNARAKVPNLGLNVITVNAGLKYTIKATQKTVEKIDSSTKARSRNEIMTYAAFGYNQREVAGAPLYNLLISTGYFRNVRNTHKFGLGFDFFIDQNYLIDYKMEYNKSARSVDQVRASVIFSYSYNVGRISFPIELGYYVFDKTAPDGPVVSRIGVRYYSKPGVVASIGLRTHFAVAYDFEYGLGYRFYIK
jgi:hypothetical protein